MIAEIGHFALFLALGLALVQSVAPIWGARRGDARLMGLAPSLALGQLVFIALAFGALIALYVQSDFSVLNVWHNSHSDKPLIYKISGAWGNHEGSMVLWVLILALFGSLVALFGGNLPERLRADVLGVQAWISAAFLLFIVATSNPFARVHPAPADGNGLNPILQDPALAIHPPLLYAGYVGFSIAFSFAIAALIEGRVDAAWARWVRPWTLLAWCFLTVGIAMGSWWAYYELGWGGWWFWDPVENASFMPWLAGTALLHTAVVMEKREALKVWTILLAILTFSLSLLGTFLVRSGVLTSVHAFATDPARGVFILALMVVFVGGALGLFAWRAPLLKQGGLFAPVSREGALVVNNLFLTTATATVFVGTLYPLALEAVTGEKISVGAPYFNLTFVPLMLPLLLLLPFGPMMAWKRGDFLGVAQRLMGVAALALAVAAIVGWWRWGGPVLASLGVGLAVWLMAGALFEVAWRVKLLRAPVDEVRRRMGTLPRSAFGTMIAHFGLGVVVLGIVSTSAWRSELITVLKPGESVEIAGRTVTFEGVSPRQGPNYTAMVGGFTARSGDRVVAELESMKRNFTNPPQQTTEAGIRSFITGDLYVVLGDPAPDGAFTVRIYDNPLVTLIWFGSVAMMLGGALSLTDRRLRVGAPRRARTPAPRPQPAE
ncbi:MAG: heme lyase CcmF/NrfE family subunit [Hyphomicrobiales bacterium]|nr:heme lyase CcmF/NrfE family subunit [Hyphomicrobiales bacterium]